MQVALTVNGQPRSAEVEPRLLLVDLLRDTFGLTGTKCGCDTGHCGACTVLLNGAAVKSCMVLAVQADGAAVTTVEGIARDGRLSALQEGLWERGGVQCGFCTPGMVMTLTDLLEHSPHPTPEQIRAHMAGNLCRCTGYQNIVSAVQYAVAKTSSPVHMIVDTPRKKLYEDRVRLLMAGDVERLVEEHYHEDAVLVSFDFVVRGRQALKEHFRNFVKWVSIKEVVSTDRFVETEDAFFYEATAVTNYGVGRVYDCYHLRDGKIVYHFTGVIK